MEAAILAVTPNCTKSTKRDIVDYLDSSLFPSQSTLFFFCIPVIGELVASPIALFGPSHPLCRNVEHRTLNVERILLQCAWIVPGRGSVLPTCAIC